jgi:resuscitation-promoting factor RpfA
MRCPRCQTEAPAAVPSCPRCAAPLLLAEGPAPAVLDVDVRIDRRRWDRERELHLGLMRGLDLELDRDLEPDLDIDPGPDLDEIHLERAPTWRRLAAAAVDAGVLAAVAAPPLIVGAGALPAGADALALLPHAAGLAAAVAFAHAALGHALLGATLGKRLLGLRVAGPDGAPPSLGRSAVRAALALAGAVPLGLGPAVALFTPSGRALHDLATGTVVVRVP